MDRPQISFGVCLQQLAWEPIRERAQLAERLGYHSVWLIDHFVGGARRAQEMPECIATLGALAVATSRIRIGSLVIGNSYRNPALLAKSLATIDSISRGRLEVGIGSGWFEADYDAYGYRFAPLGVRLAQLDEAVQILKLMLANEQASFAGRHYTIRDAPNLPRAVQQPHPPITIAGVGEKVMLRIVARHADRWNFVGVKEPERLIDVMHRHCRDAGRDPAEIDITEQLVVAVTRTESEARRRFELWVKGSLPEPLLQCSITGTPEQVIRQFRERVAKGVRMFMLVLGAPGDCGAPEDLELFAREVMPAFA
jgi:F420-dependent oxidoreductase-like protein